MPGTRVSLLQRVRSGDHPASWEEFYSVYHPFLLRYAASRGLSEADACDVVQEIFMRLFRVLQKFQYDPRRARFRTWLKRVAQNSIRDWLRRSRRRREHLLDPRDLETPDPREAKFDWDGEHRTRIVLHALSVVRAESRPLTWKCFELHCLDGRTATDVARLTGLTANGVYINAARILARVRQKCAEFDEELSHAVASALS
jgi:RNA polymerase sigma factor (sigma-70 family)